MQESSIKGLLHAAMSALAIVEAAESKRVSRRALNGLSAAYHALCALYHFRYEVDENQGNYIVNSLMKTKEIQ